MRRIAIIGGGISGLSAAYILQKKKDQGAPLDYVLFESSARFGGVIQSESIDGCLIEAGPDSFLTEKPWAASLCRDLGIEDQLIGSNDAERKTYILVKERLVPLPDGLAFILPTRPIETFFSPLFSFATKLRILGEWFRRSGRDYPESTVSEFVERHFGREMVERLAGPMLAGVYGGSVDELSSQAVLPRLVEMERRLGSLVKGALAARRLSSERSVPIFTSLKGGMQRIVEGLLKQIPESGRRLSYRIASLKMEAGRWLVVGEQRRTEEFDAVIVATPAYAAAEILGGFGELASQLNSIPYSSSVTVALGFDQAVRAALPAGFGFLVPRSEGHRMVAATFVHNKFPHRAPADRALVRCFFGGTDDPNILQSGDDEIVAIAQAELNKIIAISAAPLFAKIYRWPGAMAQYTLGHNTRVNRIREICAETPGLAVAGNAYGGIGVPDCIRSGSEAAAKILGEIGIS